MGTKGGRVMNGKWRSLGGMILVSMAVLFGGCSRDKPTEAGPAVTPTAPASVVSEPAETAPLKFIEKLTGGAQENEELPLVIAIHGLGDRPEKFSRYFEGMPIRTRLILPFAPLIEGEGFSWFRVDGFKPEALAKGSTSAAREVVKMIADLKKSRKVKGKPIVTGFSQGGMLSFALAVLHPGEIGEALPVAGLLARPLFPASWPKDQPSPKITAFHGTTDDIVTFADGSDSVRHLLSIGFNATMTEYPNIRHYVSPEMHRDWMSALDAAVKKAAQP